jgi:hypothetical protein
MGPEKLSGDNFSVLFSEESSADIIADFLKKARGDGDVLVRDLVINNFLTENFLDPSSLVTYRV